jgi:pimeloyl-ACP methyl ester carboxylesterase
VASRLLVPGWGAQASLYHRAVPAEWEVLQPPSFRASHGELANYRDWLRAELDRREGPFTLAGHSFGAALIVMAAAERWAPVARLVLISPAGLPLTKPMPRAGLAFVRQFLTGAYPLRPALQSAFGAAVAPRAGLTLAREVYRLELREELEEIRRRGIPTTVLCATSDTLTTCEQCREIARLAGGESREFDVSGGHVWFLAATDEFRRGLSVGSAP